MSNTCPSCPRTPQMGGPSFYPSSSLHKAGLQPQACSLSLGPMRGPSMAMFVGMCSTSAIKTCPTLNPHKFLNTTRIRVKFRRECRVSHGQHDATICCSIPKPREIWRLLNAKQEVCTLSNARPRSPQLRGLARPNARECCHGCLDTLRGHPR